MLRTIFSTDLVWYRVFTAAEHVCNYVFFSVAQSNKLDQAKHKQ